MDTKQDKIKKEKWSKLWQLQ